MRPERILEILATRIPIGERLREGPGELRLGQWRFEAERWLEENVVILKSLGLDPPDRRTLARSVVARAFGPSSTLRQLEADIGSDLRYLSAQRYAIGITAGIDVQDSQEDDAVTVGPMSSEFSAAPREPHDEVAAEEPRAFADDAIALSPPPDARDDELFEQRVDDGGKQDEEDDRVEEDLYEGEPQEPDERDSDGRDEESAPEPGSPAALPPIALASAASAALASYDADAVEERDFVGVERVVDAFAYLIAACSLRPPMAVGLFGHWGSGKSFLMRAIERRVDEITRAARESGRDQADIGIYKNVVQIEFNAWHYVEGNLWASLVDHIFSNLRTSLDEGVSELDRRRRMVTKQLASTRTRHRELSSRIDQLQRERKKKEQRVEVLEKEQRKQLEEVERLKLRDIAAAAALKPDDVSLVSGALERVGVTDVDASASEAARSLEQARDVIRRGSALLVPLRKHRIGWMVLLIAAAGVAPLVSYVLENADISGATRVLASLGALLAAASAVLSAGTKWASTSLSRIEAAESRVRQRVAEAKGAQAKQLAVLRQTIDRLARDLTSASDERDAASSEIRVLEQRLTELTPGRLLAEFLEERSTSTDYRKHLGLTALVRRDFEELSRLVAENNKAIAADDGEDGVNHPTDFNRVVLYVDDLDRCPPRRVIEVLQAVHLLLSFPVFVVVVAVDPRWLSQSLRSEFEHLLGGSAPREDESHATPQDYLEKIFQIPFSVAPLGIEERERLITGLLGAEPPSIESPTGGTDLPAPQPSISNGDGSTPVGVSGTPAAESPSAEELAETEASDVLLAADEPVSAGEEEEAATDRRDRVATSAAADPPEPVDLTPVSLEFTAAERRFLTRLLPLLDASPRGIKRYINIYHLIKSVVGIEGAGDVGGGPSPHECAMLLLALQTGLPATGPELVARLAAESWTTSPDSPDATLQAMLSIEAPGDGSPEARREVARLESWLAGDAKDWPLADLADFARHVRLYSYG